MNRIEQYMEEVIGRGELSHAYLFEIRDAAERIRTGREAAKKIFCRAGTGRDGCPACRAVDSDNYPDLVYVRHEKPNLLSVDNIRDQLVDSIEIRPLKSEHKVYLVDDAQLMNPQAQNAMLKTLEEPPAYGVIFLLTDNRETLLPTILSRVVSLSWDGEGGEQAVSPAMERLFGYLGRARQLPVQEMSKAASTLKEEGLPPEELPDVLRRFWRDLSLLQAEPQAESLLYFPEEEERLREMAERIAPADLGALWEEIGALKNRLDGNVNTDNALEIFLLKVQEACTRRNDNGEN